MELDIEYKLDKEKFYCKKKSKWFKYFDINKIDGKYYLVICKNNNIEITKYSYPHFYNQFGRPIKYIKRIRKIKLPKYFKNLFQ